MQFSLNAFSIAYFISALVAGAIALVSYRRRDVTGAVTLMWIMLALTWWSGSAGVENLYPTLNWHKLWSRVGYFGVVSVPVLWLIFAIQYSQQEKAPSVRKLFWLWIVPAITMLMLWTNDWHGLVWSSVHMTSLQGIEVQAVDHGIYFWIHAVYTYGTVLAGLVIFVRRAIQAEDAYRSQAATMLLAVLILMAGNGLYLFKLLPFQGLDITPFAFTISSVVLAWGLFRFKLLDLMPIASEVVLRNLGDGILVTDASGRIIYINPALENLAGLTKGTSIGHPTTEVFYNWPDIFRDHVKKTLTDIEVQVGGRKLFFEINLSPLYENKKFVGCIYDLRDITERVKIENRQSLLRQKIEQNETGDFTPIMIAFRQDGKIVDVNTEFVLQTGFTRPEALARTALQLGLLEVTTRGDVTRQMRTQNQLVDEILLVNTKAGEPRAWKVSIGRLTLEGNEFQIWAAKPVKPA